jgi:predicted DCC family thiol-disulfide oxidoreductase YuxK
VVAPHPAREPAPLPPRVVLYDGVCGLCHRSVAWLLEHDRDRKLHYAPLQGETTARLRAQHPDIPTDLSTVVYIDEEGRVHVRSKAFLHVARHLPRPWRWAYHLRWLPAFLLDPFYWVVARTRYRIFGKHDTCRAPDVADRARLLP